MIYGFVFSRQSDFVLCIENDIPITAEMESARNRKFYNIFGKKLFYEKCSFNDSWMFVLSSLLSKKNISDISPIFSDLGRSKRGVFELGQKSKSKKFKEENAFFINSLTHRRQYNSKCQRCVSDCKQSFRAKIVVCPIYKKSEG